MSCTCINIVFPCEKMQKEGLVSKWHFRYYFQSSHTSPFSWRWPSLCLCCCNKWSLFSQMWPQVFCGWISLAQPRHRSCTTLHTALCASSQPSHLTVQAAEVISLTSCQLTEKKSVNIKKRFTLCIWCSALFWHTLGTHTVFNCLWQTHSTSQAVSVLLEAILLTKTIAVVKCKAQHLWHWPGFTGKCQSRCSSEGCNVTGCDVH